DLVALALRARVLDRGAAQDRADMIGAERRRRALHGDPLPSFDVPSRGTTGAGKRIRSNSGIGRPASLTQHVRDLTCASSVRPALRIDDLFEPTKHVHAGENLRETCVRLAFLVDGGDKLAVLELDAVH